jgi:hypothetical protein
MDLPLIFPPCYCSFEFFYISSTSLCQMANTRNRNVNAGNTNNVEASNTENPLPPSPPTLEQVLMLLLMTKFGKSRKNGLFGLLF